MALFGFTTDAVMLMALFFVSNFAYNSAVVFYNSLLASVAADRHQGLVSGLGVGLGYFGTILTLFILKAIPEKIEYETLYPILAGIFLVFALPSFLFVRERRVVSRERFTLQLARDQARTLVTTLTTLPRHRQIMWFLLGNFFCTDVLNTAILFFGDFTQNAFFVNAGTPEKENWVPRIPLELFGFEFTSRRSLLIVAGLALNILAMVFGVTLGFMSDRFGSLKTMRFSAWCLVFGLLGAALWAGDNLTLYVIAICGFGPLGLAGIWTAGRKLLIEITPRERLGEFSGLHGIAMKLSVVGSSVFGIIDSLARNWSGSELTGLRAALAFQAVPLLLGIFCLYMMHTPKTEKLMGHTDDLSTT
jgi:UMF1 family MFS transporter